MTGTVSLIGSVLGGQPVKGRSAASSLGLDVVVRHVDPDQCLAWCGNVQILLSLQPPSSEFMRTIISELDALGKECRLGTGHLLVIRSDVPPPSEEVRAYIKRELSRSSMLAAAQVVEGTGFRGAAMRSVLTMIQLTIRPRYSMKIFDNVKTGATWLSEELEHRAGAAPHAELLAHAAIELQARFLDRTLLPSSSTYPVSGRRTSG
jgi:hypothetical protein